MLELVNLPFEPSPPVLGQAVPFKVEGKGYGILYGPPWLKKTDRIQKLRAKRFGKVVMFRKTPVSKSRPDFPFLKRRPRLVKSQEVVWIVANKPKTNVRLISLKNFKQWSFNLNPKGVLAQSPSVKLDSKSVKSTIAYDSVAQQIELLKPQPFLINKEVELIKTDRLNIPNSNLSIKNTFLSSKEIYKLRQQKK